MRPNFTSAEQDQVAAALNRAAIRLGKRPKDLRIRGNDWLWFAHPQNFTALDVRTLLPGKPHSADIVLCFDQKLDPVLERNSSEVRCAYLANLPPASETLLLHGIPLHIILATDLDVRLGNALWRSAGDTFDQD